MTKQILQSSTVYKIPPINLFSKNEDVTYLKI